MGLRKFFKIINIIFISLYASRAIAATAYPPTPIASVNTEIAERWIPFSGNENNQIIIPIEIDGENIQALIDTGDTSGLTVSKEWANKHSYQLTSSGKFEVDGLSGKRWGMSIRSVKIGAYQQLGGSVDVADLENLKLSVAGNSIDAVIGGKFLLKMQTDIDFDNSRIRLRLSGKPPINGKAISITLSKNDDRIFMMARINGKSFSKLVVDTGDNGSLSLLKMLIFPYSKEWKITDIMQENIVSKFVSDYADIKSLELGNVIIGNVPTAFVEKTQAIGEEGSIGMELLNRYNLYLDGPHHLMIFTDRNVSAPPPHKTNMGIQGNITDEGWAVAHVMKNSPAAAVGLKDGDQICVVDGNKLTASSDIPRGPDGSTMHMVLCDGRKIDLVRRTFY